MKKIGIIAKKKESVKEILTDLIRWLTEKKIEVFLDKDTSSAVKSSKGVKKENLPSLVDMIIVMGGDGTLLSVARICYKAKKPLLGINLGSLGFLTSVTLDEIYTSLDQILGGSFLVEERVMLKCRIYRQGKRLKSYIVLNDIVVNRGDLARVIGFEIFINKNYVARYKADGLIVATPTGSTAYCLATGGPILYPTTNALVLTPICPFTLANRPIVIPDDVNIQIRITSEHRDVFATMDGQEGFKLEPKDKLIISKSENGVRLIHPENKDHYHVLRKKLNWGR